MIRSTILSLLGLLSVCSSSAFAEDKYSEIKFEYHQSPKDIPITIAMSKKIHLILVDIPLDKVCLAISKTHGIEIRINERALDDVGLSTDTPINFSCASAIRLDTALQVILNELDLTYRLDHGTLVISTPEDVESNCYVRYYHLAESFNHPKVTAELLSRFITNLIEPESWEVLGGPGAITPVLQGLVVRQTFQNQQRVSRFLNVHAKLLKEISENPANRKKLQVHQFSPFYDVTLQNALNRIMDAVIFSKTELAQVATAIDKAADIRIVIDKRALDDVGISAENTVTIEFKKGHSVRHVLSRLLDTLDLTIREQGDILLITTPEEAESNLILRVYPLTGPPILEEKNQAQWLKAITATISPESWESLGGPGEISYDPSIHALVVSQTSELHADIFQLLSHALNSNYSHKPSASTEKSKSIKKISPIQLPQIISKPQTSDPVAPPENPGNPCGGIAPPDPFGN